MPPTLSLLWGRFHKGEGRYSRARVLLRDAAQEFSRTEGAGTKSHVVALLAWVDMEKKCGNIYAARSLLQEVNESMDRLYRNRYVHPALSHHTRVADQSSPDQTNAPRLSSRRSFSSPSKCFFLALKPVCGTGRTIARKLPWACCTRGRWRRDGAATSTKRGSCSRARRRWSL